MFGLFASIIKAIVKSEVASVTRKPTRWYKQIEKIRKPKRNWSEKTKTKRQKLAVKRFVKKLDPTRRDSLNVDNLKDPLGTKRREDAAKKQAEQDANLTEDQIIDRNNREIAKKAIGGKNLKFLTDINEDLERIRQEEIQAANSERWAIYWNAKRAYRSSLGLDESTPFNDIDDTDELKGLRQNALDNMVY